jgi:SMC interacting uncharacterized protein involved in chromosome segregation
LDKNIKINEQNYELINGEQNNKNNKISIEIENFENKINSMNKEINKMYNLLENKMNNYEIEPINLKIEELDKGANLFYYIYFIICGMLIFFGIWIYQWNFDIEKMKLFGRIIKRELYS